MCHKLNHQDSEDLWLEINGILNGSYPHKSNLNKAGHKAIQKLKKDKNRVLLTMEKGSAMVVMDRQDCINKAENLKEEPTHRSIPTNKYSAKLISIFQKDKKGISPR